MSATHVPEIIDCGQNIPKQLINMEKHNINIFSSLPFEAELQTAQLIQAYI